MDDDLLKKLIDDAPYISAVIWYIASKFIKLENKIESTDKSVTNLTTQVTEMNSRISRLYKRGTKNEDCLE